MNQGCWIVLALLCACENEIEVIPDAPLAHWIGAPPKVTLIVRSGSEDQQLRCRNELESLGALVADEASTRIELTFDARNALRVWQETRLLVDRGLPGWGVERLCRAALAETVRALRPSAAVGEGWPAPSPDGGSSQEIVSTAVAPRVSQPAPEITPAPAPKPITPVPPPVATPPRRTAPITGGPPLSTPQEYFHRAFAHYAARRYDEALADWRHAYVLEHRAELLYDIALCELRIGQRDRSGETLRRARARFVEAHQASPELEIDRWLKETDDALAHLEP